MSDPIATPARADVVNANGRTKLTDVEIYETGIVVGTTTSNRRKIYSSLGYEQIIIDP